MLPYYRPQGKKASTKGPLAARPGAATPSNATVSRVLSDGTFDRTCGVLKRSFVGLMISIGLYLWCLQGVVDLDNRRVGTSISTRHGWLRFSLLSP